MTTKYDAVVIARDNALRNLDVVRNNLDTRIKERDDAREDLRTVQIDLNTRTQGREKLQTKLHTVSDQRDEFGLELETSLSRPITNYGSLSRSERIVWTKQEKREMTTRARLW